MAVRSDHVQKRLQGPSGADEPHRRCSSLFPIVVVRHNLTSSLSQPLALLAQWMDEIESKTVAKQFSVLIHHGPTKVKTKKELARYDVVSWGSLDLRVESSLTSLLRSSPPTIRLLENGTFFFTRC